MPKQYSYQNHPVVYKVLILGVDITSDVQSIQGIETSLDYPNINEFRVNEATLVLQDPDNDYNPQKANNFYETNGRMETPVITESGYRSPVVIRAGFLVNGAEELETIYSGQILNIYKDAKTKDVRIICSDESQKIRDEPVTDFGVPKKMLVESSGGSLHGNYPFFSGLTQPSEDSVSGTEGGDNLTRKQVLRTEGPLDNRNFRETNFGIETEGSPTDDDPVLEFKAPWRSRTVKTIIERLLRKYGITYDVQLPIATRDNNFFSNLGKAEYETAFKSDIARSPGVDPGIWQWTGSVTDMIADNTNNVIYLLVSQHGNKISNEPLGTQPLPKIIKWDLETDDRVEVVQISGSRSNIAVEAWKFIGNTPTFDTFYVLGCEPVYIRSSEPRSSNLRARPGFEFGSYDSSEYNDTANSKVKIYQVQNATTNPSSRVYIDTSVSNNLYPQLAMHYHLGFSRTDSTSQNRYPNRQGNLPDSRRNLFLDGTTLYYPFANRDEFGVAKATARNTATLVIKTDKDTDGFNMAGFDFWLDSTYVYFAFTNITGTNSRFRILRSSK